jgi:peptidoglycan/LPS O-acetylase OafA/YrhL
LQHIENFPRVLMATSERRIPSLDGLRAVSIALVIVSHAGLHYSLGSFGGRLLPWIGATGVATFFVISGFLITHLLLKEEDARGTISLPRFYLRRAFRILPPFYAMAVAVLLARNAGLVEVSRGAWLSAVTFTWNYSPYATGWTLAHTWSLSLEEQFYLLWPLALVLLGRKRAGRLALVLILCAPFLRVASYVLLPALRAHNRYMLHTRIDNLMFGCILALFYEHPWMNELRKLVLRPWVLGGAFAILAFVSPLLSVRFGGMYDLPFGLTINGACIALLLFWAVREPDTMVGHVLNHRWLVHVGVLSYSLYLWQQLLMNPWNHFWGGMVTGIALTLLAAELSYMLIERPALRLRARIETMIPRRAETWPRALAPAQTGEHL